MSNRLIRRSKTDEKTGISASIDFEIKIDACEIVNIIFSTEEADILTLKKLIAHCIVKLRDDLPHPPLVWEIGINKNNQKYLKALIELEFKQHFCNIYECYGGGDVFGRYMPWPKEIKYISDIYDYADRMNNKSTTP